MEYNYIVAVLVMLVIGLSGGSTCPDVIPNGALSETCTAEVGFNCEYTCDEGYSKSSHVTTITCESTTNWSPNPHSLCTNYNQCPYDIPGADLDLSCRRHPGEQCSYTCREGYVHSHYATADCLSTLDWMQRIDSICIEIKCPFIIEHGLIVWPCTGKYGEICQSYKCYAPYIKPPLPPVLKCNASRTLDNRDTLGFWDWNKDMGKPCVNEDDFCPSAFSNGKIASDCHLQPGAECSYSCDAGCEKDPSVSKVHCGIIGGRWNENTDNLCSNCRRCPDSIPNGSILSILCERLPSTSCTFTCDYGCREAVSSLYCNSDGEWSHPSPCTCSDADDTESSSYVIIIVVVAIAVFFLLVLGGFCLFSYRLRVHRRFISARGNAIPMTYPSAPILDGRSPATNYEPSPYSPAQTEPRHTDTNGRQDPPGYGAVHTVKAAAGTDTAPEFSGHQDDDTLKPPPSYEQVSTDPSRFQA